MALMQRLTLLLPLCLLLSACASGVRGEAPFAQVGGWRLDGDTLGVDLRLRNVNDEPLKVEAVDLAVDLGDGGELFRHAESRAVEIAAGGFETLRFEVTPTAAGREAFDRLAAGETTSLAYRLRGTVSTAKTGELAIAHSGRIYPVPGRPGEFR